MVSQMGPGGVALQMPFTCLGSDSSLPPCPHHVQSPLGPAELSFTGSLPRAPVAAAQRQALCYAPPPSVVIVTVRNQPGTHPEPGALTCLALGSESGPSSPPWGKMSKPEKQNPRHHPLHLTYPCQLPGRHPPSQMATDAPSVPFLWGGLTILDSAAFKC